MDYRFHTVNDATLAGECGKLRAQMEPGITPLFCVMVPVGLALCIAFALRHNPMLSAVFGIGTAALLFQLWQFRRAMKRDNDGLHRTATFTGNEIVLSVQESGNTYQFFREDIQAAAFSDHAGLLFLKDACIAVSADGFEEGSYANFRAEIEAQTAEKTAVCRKDGLNRTICIAVSCLICVIISVLYLFGVF